MAEKIQVVKFTGSNADLFTRESADDLRATAQVVVPETHTVLLIKDGILRDGLTAGRHNIFDTESGFFGPKKDSEVATVEFVFVSKTAKLPMLWGTPSPLRTRDPITGVHIAVGFNGELEFRVATPKKFYLELVGADVDYSIDKLKKRVLVRLMSVIEPLVAQTMSDERICYTDFALKKHIVSGIVREKVSELFYNEYGLELCSFVIASAIISDADLMNIERKRDELALGKKCPHCGVEVGNAAKFCPECGTPLTEIVCPDCGTKLPPTAKFCMECGKKIK